MKSESLFNISAWKAENLFLLKLSLLSFLIFPRALNSKAGLTRDDPLENWLDARLSSSRFSNLPMSSGSVTRLLAYKSRVLSLLMEYRLLILAGVIELYDRLSDSSLSKSSGCNAGTIRMKLYCKLISASYFKFRNCSSLTWLSERSIELKF